MNNPFRLRGVQAASNALTPPPTTVTGETVDPWKTSTPAGGSNIASMIAGGVRKASDYIRENRNTVGYALGGAAKAIMGPRQDAPAAQLGGLGMQLNQQQAFKSTTAKMLAGVDLADIPEASVLAPEQVSQITTQASDVKKTRHGMEMDRLKYELELKKAGLEEQEIKTRMAYYDAQTGYTRRQTETLEDPEKARKAEQANKLETIKAEGEETRKNIAAQGGEERKNITARSAAEVQTAVNTIKAKFDFTQEKGVTPEQLVELMSDNDVDITDAGAVGEWMRNYNSLAKAFGRTPLKEIEPIWTIDRKNGTMTDQFGNTKPLPGAPKG